MECIPIRRDKALAALPGVFARHGEAEAAEKAAAQEQQVHELYAEIGRLTTELGWLKKSWSAWPQGVNGRPWWNGRAKR